MQTTRRQFIRTAALAGVATSSLVPALVTGRSTARSSAPLAKVRLGFIGVGSRGRTHLEQALFRDDVEILAICDSDPEAISRANELIRKAGRSAPVAYTNGNEAYLELLKRANLDGVLIATPGEWHTPMAIASMKAGKYTGVDVAATATLQESWDLVNVSEQTGVPCMMLENVCYRRDVLAVLTMIRQGLFGAMTYAHCGYQHSLQAATVNASHHASTGFGANDCEGDHWRTQHSVNPAGGAHPAHGLGPVAHWFNINRGNRFVSLTSTATKSRGLHRYVVNHGEAGHSDTSVNFGLSEVITTVIQCANGETIVLIHDTGTPRPYSPGFRVQGTNGVWMGSNDIIHLEGVTDVSAVTTAGGTDPKAWEPFGGYQAHYDHPLWKKHDIGRPQQMTGNLAHGDTDYLVIQAFIDSVKTQTQPPIDVYDAALWSAIRPLAEESLAGGSKVVEIPDFTRGKWETNKPIFGLNAIY